ncbi:hypothetical protein [Microviridae sp.]|nr:hypothetical protein [Microviridae sp.]
MARVPDFAQAGSNAARAATEASVSRETRKQKAAQAEQSTAAADVARAQVAGIGAKAALDLSSAETQKFQQAALRSDITRNEALARSTDMDTVLKTHGIPKASTEAHVYTDPILRNLMIGQLTVAPKGLTEKAAVASIALGFNAWDWFNNWLDGATKRSKWSPGKAKQGQKGVQGIPRNKRGVNNSKRRSTGTRRPRR